MTLELTALARQRLPESVLQRLVPGVAESLEQQVPLASAMVWAAGTGMRPNHGVNE